MRADARNPITVQPGTNVLGLEEARKRGGIRGIRSATPTCPENDEEHPTQNNFTKLSLGVKTTKPEGFVTGWCGRGDLNPHGLATART